MGLVRFLKKCKEKWQATKFNYSNEKTINKLSEFAMGYTRVEECVYQLAKHTQKRISILLKDDRVSTIRGLDKLPQSVFKIYIIYYLKLLQFFLNEDEYYLKDSKQFARWLAKYLHENHDDFNEYDYEMYERQFTSIYSSLDKAEDFKSLINLTIDELAYVYDLRYNIDVFNHEGNIRKLLKLEADRLKTAINSAEDGLLSEEFKNQYQHMESNIDYNTNWRLA